MPRPLRFIPEDYRNWTDSYGRPIAVVEVTIRTLLGMFLLKPTKQNRDLIIGVMAHVQSRLKFDVYAYAWLSNHGSYLIGVTGSDHQAAIMQEIHSQLARELGRPEYSNWNGAFWGRRGRPILVADEADQIQRLKYCLANATKEHLVTRPERWPGAHAAKALCGTMTDKGVWIDRTKLDALKRLANSDNKLCLQACTQTVTLTLSKLPCLAHLTDLEYQEEMKSLCREIADEAAEDRRLSGASVIGIKRLLRYSPHHVPDTLERSPAPIIHSHCSKFRAAFKAAYKDFVGGYRAALNEFLYGVGARLFPEGGLAPGYSFVSD